MKSITSIKRAFAVILAAIMILMVGCGTQSAEPTDPANLGKKHNLSFVIMDDTNWDKEVTLGSYSYTIHVNLNEDGTLELVGTCTGEGMATGGGQGGGSQCDGAEEDTTPATEGSDGSEGTGESTPAESTPAESTPATEGNDSANGEQGGTAESTPATTEAPMTDEEKAAQNFTQSGTWVYEKGLGYTLTINGETVKTNYEKESGRTYFFFDVKNGTDADGNVQSTGVIQFAAKDTGFRADMAEDYVRWEDRDAIVGFFTAQTNTGNNPNSTRLWILPDGQATSLVYSGSSYTYKIGTWVKNEDNTITVDIGGSQTTCEYTTVNGKDAYRVTYNSMQMYSEGATRDDFDGAVVKTLTCEQGDYELHLTSKGVCRLVNAANGKDEATGSYTEEGGVLTVTIGGTAFTAEGNTLAIDATVSANTSDPCVTTQTISRVFNVG